MNECLRLYLPGCLVEGEDGVELLAKERVRVGGRRAANEYL